MRTLLTLIAVVFLWIVVFARFGVIWRHRNSHTPGDTAARIWLIAIWMGTSLSFQIDDIQSWLGNVTGINNVGWYLAYLFGAFSFYHLSELSRLSLGWDSYRSLPPLVIVLVGLSALYWNWIRLMPEWTQRSPRIWQESIFLILYFGYATLSGSLGLISIVQSYRHYQVPSLQLRSGFAVVTATVALSCFIFKIIYAVIAFYLPDSTITLRINQAATIAMALSVLGFMLLFVPHRFVLRLMTAYEFLQKARRLYELRLLQQRLLILCPPIVWEEPSWWDQLRDIDLYLFRRVVSIMDSHRMLSGFLASAPPRAESMIVWQGEEPIVWKPYQFEEAKRLHALLTVPPDIDLDALQSHYQRVGRQLT